MVVVIENTDHIVLLTLPRRLCFHPSQFFCRLICQQDYTKTTTPISTKLIGGMVDGPGPEINLFKFGMDAGKMFLLLSEVDNHLWIVWPCPTEILEALQNSTFQIYDSKPF